MGMDVIGKQPTSEIGKHFGHSLAGWTTIADLVQTLAPNETKACRRWYSNDGDGLDAVDAARLAEQLTVLLAGGEVKASAADHNNELAQLPNEICQCCRGTGACSSLLCQTDDRAHLKIPYDAKSWDGASTHPRAGELGRCSFCDGRGWSKSWGGIYPIKESDIIAFRNFAAASGGFEIW